MTFDVKSLRKGVILTTPATGLGAIFLCPLMI